MDVIRDPFRAIADPTRRRIIDLLAASEQMPINKIASCFPASRQAVTKHLKILRDAGLIEIIQKGRTRYCSVNLTPLRNVFNWISAYQVELKDESSSLDDYLSSRDS
jgi:DNA-binding transcriptional ArsR family regulator